jgi:hypothetical protein
MTFITSRPPFRGVLFEEAGEALGRLVVAASSDTGGARCVAEFLLSWWDGDAGSYGVKLSISKPLRLE